MKQKLGALKIILSKELLLAGSNMHTTTLYIDYKIIESECALKVYDAVMLINYKDYVLCVQSCICLGITDSHIIYSRDFPFLTLAFLVATLLAGMKFCESYVVATVGLYM